VPDQCLTNKHYQNFKDFRAAIDDCLNRMAGEYLPELKSLITLNFEFFTSHKTS
jgi:hypothetical protein